MDALLEKDSSHIIPVIDVAFCSKHLQKHIDDLTGVLHKLIGSIEKQRLLKMLPIINWELPPQCPGEAVFYLIAKNIKHHDLVQFFSEMLSQWLVPGTQIQLLSIKHLHFKLVEQKRAPHKEAFIIVEIMTFVEDETTLDIIKKNFPQLAHEITLGAVSVYNAKQILTSKGITLDQKTDQIHKMMLRLAKGKLKSIAADLFTEMQHVLLSCDEEFKRIRDIKHIARLICYGNWFRRFLRGAKKEAIDQRKVTFKLTRPTLHFAFGIKHVVGITLAINFIKEYERFDEKHILKACQKIVPNIRAIPHSYFCYGTSSDSVRTYYMEIEKNDGSAITKEEMHQLRVSLGNEIVTSIEQLSHRLFMPHNEEEVMRNILLLSQEIRYVHDVPQIILSFQSQSETTITFLIILVRTLKNPDLPTLEKLFKNRHDLVTFVPLSRKIVGKLRNKYPKEANTFLLECQKAPFLRQDHSVDLSRARQFVGSTISQVIGEVRDFNGGLILQQNQLLISLKNILSAEELKYELHLENLFHSISPILMKSLLTPEHLRSLFQLFLSLHANADNSAVLAWEKLWEQHRSENALAIMIRMKAGAPFDQLQTHLDTLDLKDLEHASSTFKADGSRYRGYIILSDDIEKLQMLVAVLEHLAATSKGNSEHVLKISLPRPTSLLDPRIGTDRTSGIVIKMLYEGLMRIDTTGKSVPAAAKEVIPSPDMKSYTFHLRPSKWSNGKPVLAHDFEYAWKKILDPGFASHFAYLFYPIKNARAIKKGEMPIDTLGVHAIDDNTLEVELEHPAPFFLELTSHWAYSPLCKEIDELHPGWAYYGGDTYICNGPFRLAKWKRNAEIQAVKNHEYWDSKSVHLDQIDISIIENPKTAFGMYKRGELDWIGEPLSEIPLQALKEKQLEEEIHSQPISAVHWYECNTMALPFTTPKLRRALAMAIDRTAIIKEFLQESQSPAFSILPPNLSLLKKPLFHDGDPALAQRIFHEGLEEIGLHRKTVPKISITCSDQELHRSIGHFVSKQWKEVLDLDVHVETFKWDRYMEKCLQHDFQVMAMTWYSWYNDPIYNLEQLKYKTDDMNMTQWQNNDYISLLNEAQVCLDSKNRKALLREAEKIVMEEMPIIPLFCYTFRYMKKAAIENIFLSHLGQIDFKWAQINDIQ